MDKQQFATISIGIKAAYPASKILEDTASMDFWYMMLKDIPYEVAENAVMEHICTNVFPPNIAEIRKLCMERCRQPVPSFDEAWGVVQKAISRYGRERPQEAFETMDELTRTIVKNLGWTRLCCSENMTADRANFRKRMKPGLIICRIAASCRSSWQRGRRCCKSSIFRPLKRNRHRGLRPQRDRRIQGQNLHRSRWRNGQGNLRRREGGF